jgi:hypothetical protein
MTLNEALKALRKGLKVSHKYFTSDEYVHMVDDSILTEDGYNFEGEFFTRKHFRDGWDLHDSEIAHVIPYINKRVEITYRHLYGGKSTRKGRLEYEDGWLYVYDNNKYGKNYNGAFEITKDDPNEIISIKRLKE